jgi:Raf kinase inhibitor-like YbhB/YbcL family protein
LIVDDPNAPKRAWTHWLLYDIPTDVTSLAEGLGGDDLPPGTREGLNDWKRVGWGGPCPPTGRHRYVFRLYALNESLGDLHQPTKTKLEKAIEGRVIEMAELVGTYEKRGG